MMFSHQQNQQTTMIVTCPVCQRQSYSNQIEPMNTNVYCFACMEWKRNCKCFLCGHFMCAPCIATYLETQQQVREEKKQRQRLKRLQDNTCLHHHQV